MAFINLEDQQFITKELPFLESREYNCFDGMVKDKIDPNIVWISANGEGIMKYNVKEKKIEKVFFEYNKGISENEHNYIWSEFIQINKYNRI